MAQALKERSAQSLSSPSKSGQRSSHLEAFAFLEYRNAQVKASLASLDEDLDPCPSIMPTESALPTLAASSIFLTLFNVQRLTRHIIEVCILCSMMCVSYCGNDYDVCLKRNVEA